MHPQFCDWSTHRVEFDTQRFSLSVGQRLLQRQHDVSIRACRTQHSLRGQWRLTHMHSFKTAFSWDRRQWTADLALWFGTEDCWQKIHIEFVRLSFVCSIHRKNGLVCLENHHITAVKNAPGAAILCSFWTDNTVSQCYLHMSSQVTLRFVSISNCRRKTAGESS